MAKVLLVEDDNNLREIFEMRLQAEGYETLAAADGEEALVVATKEKPDLIIADIMMPKLSGFEMVETLRAAPQMASIKVIMMTALGQAEDRARGEKLGVVKYLVKSQVTLEDFVRVVREVLPPPSGSAKTSTDTSDDQKGRDNKLNNRQESEQTMQDDNTNKDMAGANPMGAPADDQMSSDDQKKMVDDKVNDFAANAPAGDSTMPSAAPPMPPADGSPVPPAEPKPEEGGPAMPPSGM